MVIEVVLGPFIGGLAGAVAKMVGVWAEARMVSRVESARVQLAHTDRDSEYQHELRMHRLRLEGRVASPAAPVRAAEVSVPLHGSEVPIALVSAMPPGGEPAGPDVPRRVGQLLTGLSDLSEYLQLQSGLSPGNVARGRIVDGALGAKSIAAMEFTRKPAIIVFFDVSGGAVTANAVLSTVFNAADGSPSLVFPIARYHRDGGGTAPLGGHLPSWQGIDLDALPDRDPAEVIATTVSAFLLATVDAYWHLRTGLSPNLFARSGVGTLLEGLDGAAPVASEPPAAANGAAWRRIESESGRLVVKGFGVEAEELPNGLIGLHASGPLDVRFVLAADYPRTAPLAVAVDGVEIEIAEKDWSPECSIIDIVEAVWNSNGR
ncbi:hypothetical protein [Glycomyces harbinensis]|uniref:hypothetical protein n=1 Tax=Glycomyces harbinensis TaxID=58114 RepID=UPI000B84D4AC|nr:hypothetical protein [Glycomyces harbinensis]